MTQLQASSVPTAARAAFELERLRAVILDVDGTLYDQAPVRRTMLWRLLRTYAGRPRELVRTARIIHAYRAAQESLRLEPELWTDLAAAQHALAGRASRTDVAEVARCVGRWMDEEPLDALNPAKHDGLVDFLEAARARGLRLGVVSDYPPAAKLEALGVAGYFGTAVCAQDPEVQRFKPDPRGIEVALRRLGVRSEQAVYVGDRRDVDTEAAARAGVGCVILDSRIDPVVSNTFLSVSGFRELSDVVCG